MSLDIAAMIAEEEAKKASGGLDIAAMIAEEEAKKKKKQQPDIRKKAMENLRRMAEQGQKRTRAESTTMANIGEALTETYGKPMAALPFQAAAGAYQPFVGAANLMKDAMPDAETIARLAHQIPFGESVIPPGTAQMKADQLRSIPGMVEKILPYGAAQQSAHELSAPSPGPEVPGTQIARAFAGTPGVLAELAVPMALAGKVPGAMGITPAMGATGAAISGGVEGAFLPIMQAAAEGRSATPEEIAKSAAIFKVMKGMQGQDRIVRAGLTGGLTHTMSDQTGEAAFAESIPMGLLAAMGKANLEPGMPDIAGPLGRGARAVGEGVAKGAGKAREGLEQMAGIPQMRDRAMLRDAFMAEEQVASEARQIARQDRLEANERLQAEKEANYERAKKGIAEYREQQKIAKEDALEQLHNDALAVAAPENYQSAEAARRGATRRFVAMARAAGIPPADIANRVDQVGNHAETQFRNLNAELVAARERGEAPRFGQAEALQMRSNLKGSGRGNLPGDLEKWLDQAALGRQIPLTVEQRLAKMYAEEGLNLGTPGPRVSPPTMWPGQPGVDPAQAPRPQQGVPANFNPFIREVLPEVEMADKVYGFRTPPGPPLEAKVMLPHELGPVWQGSTPPGFGVVREPVLPGEPGARPAPPPELPPEPTIGQVAGPEPIRTERIPQPPSGLEGEVPVSGRAAEPPPPAAERPPAAAETPPAAEAPAPAPPKDAPKWQAKIEDAKKRLEALKGKATQKAVDARAAIEGEIVHYISKAEGIPLPAALERRREENPDIGPMAGQILAKAEEHAGGPRRPFDNVPGRAATRDEIDLAAEQAAPPAIREAAAEAAAPLPSSGRLTIEAKDAGSLRLSNGEVVRGTKDQLEAVERYLASGETVDPFEPGRIMTTPERWARSLFSTFDIARQVGGTAGREAFATGQKIADLANRIQGKLSPYTNQIKTIYSNKTKVSKHLVNWANAEEVEFGVNHYSNFYRAVEGKLDPSRSVQAQDVIVEPLQRLNYEAGRIMQFDKHMQWNQLTKQWEPFKVTEILDAKGASTHRSPIMLRHYTPEFRSILHDGGKGPLRPQWEQLTKNLALAEGKPEAVILEQLVNLRDQVFTKHMNMETSRLWMNMPNAMTMNVKGKMVRVPLLEVDPYQSAIRAADGQSWGLAKTKILGQDLDGSQAVALEQRLAPNLGDTIAKDVINALNGNPISKPREVIPGQAERWLMSAKQMVDATRMSMSGFANAPEIVGNLRRVAGNEAVIKGLAEYATAGKEGRRRLVRDMEFAGEITRDVERAFTDPLRLPESTAEKVRTQLGSSIFGTYSLKMNELNERFAAMAGRHMVKEIRESGADRWRVQGLRDLQFSEPEIDILKMSDAQAKAAGVSMAERTRLLRAAVTRMAPQTQGTNLRHGQRARALEYPLVRGLTSYQSYMLMQFNSTFRSLESIWKGPTVQDKLTAAGAFANDATGKAAAGLTAMTMMALVRSGGTETGAKRNLERIYEGPEDGNEAENLFRIFSDSWARSVGGPILTAGQLYAREAAGQKVGARDVISSYSMIAGAMFDTVDYAKGEGRYRNMAPERKALEFLNVNYPLSRPLAEAAAINLFGRYSTNPETAKEFDFAYKRLQDWARSNKIVLGTGGRPPKDKFPEYMGRAYRVIFEAGPDIDYNSAMAEVQKNIELAIGVPGHDLEAAASSLRSRRKRSMVSATEWEAFRKSYPEAAGILDMHDKALESWADSIK